MNSEETDILLASLISLLQPPIPPHPDLLNALADNDGNPEAAARSLTYNKRAKSMQKRKRATTGLDSWLSLPKNEFEEGPSTSSASRAAKRTKPESQNSQISTTKASGRDKPSSIGFNTDSPKPVNLLSVLRDSSSSAPSSAPRLPPLLLSNPTMVAQHTPCTLHYSVLPQRLACELFYTMLDAAQSWSRNKWWLFDRLVESPHRTSFFARVDGFETDGNEFSKANESTAETWKEAAQFWYNGRKTDSPLPFPEEMEAACQYVEKIVNEEMRKRSRFPLEWGGSLGAEGDTWRANVAASNCYEGAKESVGFHSDQLTYLGPYPTIASLSLGTTRTFRLREVISSADSEKRQARTYNTALPHNSLIIMHASTQERFKHCVPPQPTIDIFRPPYPRRRIPGTCSASPTPGTPNIDIDSQETEGSNCRINITFRFYRPDYRPRSIPRCKCGVPCILRPDMKHRVDRDTALSSSGLHFTLSNETKEPKKAFTRGNTPVINGTEEMNSKGGEANHNEKCYTAKYWWTCYSGAQNEGKGCGMWKVMDIKTEGRGPFIGVSG